MIRLWARCGGTGRGRGVEEDGVSWRLCLLPFGSVGVGLVRGRVGVEFRFLDCGLAHFLAEWGITVVLAWRGLDGVGKDRF